MIALYTELNDKGLIKSNNMSDAQENEYNKIRSKK